MSEQPSSGGGLALAALAVALLVAVVAGGWLADPDDTPAEVAAARQEAEVARNEAAVAAAERDTAVARLQAEAAQEDQRAAAGWRPFRVAAWNLLAIIVPVIVLAALCGWVWTRRGLIMPRKTDGALPFHLSAMTVDDSRAALAQRQAADLALASQQPVPQSLTWSPKYDWRNQQDITTADAKELPAMSVPSLAEVLADTERVHLGTTDAGRVDRPWGQLLTLAIGGMSGSGKTTTGASITLQSLAAGHQVVIADPHSADPQSLAAKLQPVWPMLWRPVATTEAEVHAAVQAVERVLRERAEGRDPDRQPVTLVLDELTKVMRGGLSAAIAALLEGVAQEGRKLGVRAVLLGQRWSASRTGGTGDLRDTIPDFLLHRMRRVDARMLSGLPTDELPDTANLPPGHAYLLSGDDGVVRVVQPQVLPHDVSGFAATVTGNGTRVQPANYPGAIVAGYTPEGPSPDVGGTRVDPRSDPGALDAARVLALFAAGDGIADITDEVAGTRDRNAKRWKTTRRQVEDVIRAHIADQGRKDIS